MHWMLPWWEDKVACAACDAINVNQYFFDWLDRRGYRLIFHGGRYGYHAWGCLRP